MTTDGLTLLGIVVIVALPAYLIWGAALIVRSALKSYSATGKLNRIASAAYWFRDFFWPFDHLSSLVDDNDPQADVKRMRNRWRLIGLQPYIQRWAFLSIGLGFVATLPIRSGRCLLMHQCWPWLPSGWLQHYSCCR